MLRLSRLLPLLALAACGSPPADRQEPVRLTVSAAASLRDAMAEIEPLFEARSPGADVRFNFGSSGALRQQIEQGARVDVFISAAERPMDELAARGLVDTATRRVLAGNELVLVVPAADPSPVRSFAELTSARVRRVAMGAPASVPAGEYARETLRTLRIEREVAGKTVYAQNVRQVLAYVESGNVDAGIVYRTDAAASGRVRVVAAAPPGSHGPVTYPLAVVSSTRHPREARVLAGFLLGAESRSILGRRGFRVPSPAPSVP